MPQNTNTLPLRWRKCRCRLQNQPKLLILLSIHIGSRLPLCLRKNEKGKRSCFSRSIFWTIFPTMTFIFFSNIILFVSVGHFPAGSSSVKIKATYWRIPIDPFWFGLWAGNNFLFPSSSAGTICCLLIFSRFSSVQHHVNFQKQGGQI